MCILCVFRRIRLYFRFVERILKYQNIHLFTIEATYGKRQSCIKDNEKLQHERHTIISLQTNHEIWIKENLINLAVQRLPENWEYVCWCDTDLIFQNDNWTYETIEMLQHYPVVQCFQTCGDLAYDGHIMHTYKSFCYQLWLNHGCYKNNNNYNVYHPGYVWACTRYFWNLMGGLVDYAILGSADHHMALAFIGQVQKSYHQGVCQNYKLLLKNFEDRVKCQWYNLGYVNGTILHEWHGSKKLRRYKERWSILVDNNFDPLSDIKKDCQGLYQLAKCKPMLKFAIQRYFCERNEDSVEIE